MPQDFNLSDLYASLPGPDTQGPQQMPDMPTMGPQVQPTNLMNQPSANNGGLPAAVSTANAWGVEAKKREVEQQAISQLQMSVDPINGKVTVKDMPSFLMNDIMGKYKAFNQIQDIYQQKVAEKQAELAYQQSHPWQNALATIAGSLAANDPNPITRGLGQAAQQLNPTRAQLQAQQMQLLQGQAQAAGQGLQAAEGIYKMQNDMSRPKFELEKQKADDARAYKLLENARRAAAGGQPVSAESFMAGASQMGFSPEAAAKLYQLHVGEATAYKAGKLDEGNRKLEIAAKLEPIKTQGAKDRAQYQHGLDMAKQAAAFQNGFERLHDQQGFQVELKKMGATIDEDKELSKVAPLDRRRLIAARDIDKYTSDMRQILDSPEMVGYTGPLQWQRILPRFAQSPNRVKVEEYAAQELGRINKMIGGGVRMVSSPEGRKYITDNLGFKTNMTAESIRGVLDNIDKIAATERESVIEAYPLKRWEYYPELLGNSYNYAVGISSGKRDVAPAGMPGVSAKGPVASGPVPGANRRSTDIAPHAQGGKPVKTYKPGDDPLGLGIK